MRVGHKKKGFLWGLLITATLLATLLSGQGWAGNSDLGEVKDEGKTIRVLVEVASQSAWLFSGEVGLPAVEANALEALKATGVPFKARGDYVYEVAGEREDLSTTAGWKYKVNGVIPAVSAPDYPVKDGDLVTWWYAGDFLCTGPKLDRDKPGLPEKGVEPEEEKDIEEEVKEEESVVPEEREEEVEEEVKEEEIVVPGEKEEEVKEEEIVIPEEREEEVEEVEEVVKEEEPGGPEGPEEKQGVDEKEGQEEPGEGPGGYGDEGEPGDKPVPVKEEETGKGFSPHKVWNVVFNVAVDPRTVTPENILVLGARGESIEVVLYLAEGNRVVRVQPVASYTPGNTYTLRVTRGVYSQRGAGLTQVAEKVFKIAAE